MAANCDFIDVSTIHAIGMAVKISRKRRKARPAQRHQSMGFLATGRAAAAIALIPPSTRRRASAP